MGSRPVSIFVKACILNFEGLFSSYPQFLVVFWFHFHQSSVSWTILSFSCLLFVFKPAPYFTLCLAWSTHWLPGSFTDVSGFVRHYSLSFCFNHHGPFLVTLSWTVTARRAALPSPSHDDHVLHFLWTFFGSKLLLGKTLGFGSWNADMISQFMEVYGGLLTGGDANEPRDLS